MPDDRPILASTRFPPHPPLQNASSKTYDGLFGRKAVEGHSFLLAKARDINAAAAAGEACASKCALADRLSSCDHLFFVLRGAHSVVLSFACDY